jgi:hypothetical protein
MMTSYIQVGAFSGLGKERIICWDNRRAPNSEEANLLRYLYHFATIPNSQVATFTHGLNFGEFLFYEVG